jgi:hypothetical protein
MSQEEKEKIRKFVSLFYKDETGRPLCLTDGQCEIFYTVVSKKFKRVHIMTFTQYGKSLVTALAVLTRVTTYPEKWAIIAGKQKQAAIIMSYIIEHLFDNDYTKQKLELEPQESLERLRRERSKNRLVFRVSPNQYGEVFILSAEARNQEQAANALMGFGVTGGVILDEAALINDQMEAKVFRMLASNPEAVYIKIGNPFFRNHFFRDYQNPNFYKINIDYHQGLKEGRITQEFVEEAKKRPYFSILYENKFPAIETVDSEGWSPLITEDDLEKALIELPSSLWIGDKVMGHDVARGGRSYNVWVLRTKNYATILARNQDKDLMSVTGTTIRLGKEYEILSENWFIDDIGAGAGETDRLRELGYNCHAVTLSARAVYFTRFENKRAENYWRLKQWLEEGGKLDPRYDWSELLNIRYRAKDSTGRLQIMPKEIMFRKGISSPDIADALMLTFDENPYNLELANLQEEFNNQNEQYG